MTLSLTAEAQTHLDRYLRRMKWSLAGASAVDAAEVERDILAHIGTELEEEPKPVDSERLEAVLEQLGSPSQWLPAEDLAWWRRMVLRVWVGPEEWRLAYLTFGLFLLGVVPLPTIALFLPASFLLARAAVSLADASEQPLGARRWLVYPPLLLVYGSIVMIVLALPFGAVGGVFEAWSSPADRPEIFTGWHVSLLAATAWAGLAGVWWTILGLIGAIKPQAVRALFFPFLQRYRSLHGWLTSTVGVLLLLGAGAVFLLRA